MLAALGTPLVLSVHTIVSTDFATALVPGWHTTIFPPYFVAGAIFSGMAMVLTLMLVARKTMRLEDYITPQHIDAMCSLVILTSGLVGLAYGTEFFIAFYSGSPYEQFAFYNRALGPLAWGYWIMVSCNVMIPQLFWFDAGAPQPDRRLHHLAVDQRRDVVRALHHHRRVAAARLPPVGLVRLHADVD